MVKGTVTTGMFSVYPDTFDRAWRWFLRYGRFADYKMVANYLHMFLPEWGTARETAQTHRRFWNMSKDKILEGLTSMHFVVLIEAIFRKRKSEREGTASSWSKHFFTGLGHQFNCIFSETKPLYAVINSRCPARGWLVTPLYYNWIAVLEAKLSTPRMLVKLSDSVHGSLSPYKTSLLCQQWNYDIEIEGRQGVTILTRVMGMESLIYQRCKAYANAFLSQIGIPCVLIALILECLFVSDYYCEDSL